MCAIDLRPVNIVLGMGFRLFCRNINEDYKVPSATTVQKYIGLEYDNVKEAVIKSLKGQHVSLTTDMWTSAANHGYITLTCHYITEDWQLKNNVLATRELKERHTGVNIAQCIGDLKDEFGLGSVTCIVTDNASNMNVAALESGISRVSCFSHSLQLAINDGLKQNEIAKTISVARKLVGHFNHSTLATNALRDYQVKMGAKQPLKVMQDVITRWNSSYHMMQRLLDLRTAIYAVVHDDNITKPSERTMLDIRERYWDIMQEVSPVLRPLAEATQLLTKDTEPTSGFVYKILHSLLPYLQTIGNDSAPVAEMKIRIRDSIMRRFSVNETGEPDESVLRSMLCMSAALDPRSKSLSFMRSEKQDTLKGYLKELLQEDHQHDAHS